MGGEPFVGQPAGSGSRLVQLHSLETVRKKNLQSTELESWLELFRDLGGMPGRHNAVKLQTSGVITLFSSV